MPISHYILVDRTPKVEDDLLKWAEWMEERKNRIVRQTAIGNVFISTVFLGLDYSFGGQVPILFETMIFGGKHDGYQERYTTWALAEKGHQKALSMVRFKVINGGKSNEAS